MTYNVFSGMLNPAQSINQSTMYIVDSPPQLVNPSTVPPGKHGQPPVQQMSLPQTEKMQVIKLEFSSVIIRR